MTHSEAGKVQAHVFLREGGRDSACRFLVLRRPSERGAFWQPVTGNVNSGGELQACARREMREELGIDQVRALHELYSYEFEKSGCRSNKEALDRVARKIAEGEI